LNGNPNTQLDDIVDIDISLTPFTNTLPVNRLQLKDGERQVIEVIYFDIFGKEIKPVKQVYTRLTSTQYVYENYDGSFKANLVIDEQGLVVDYPELFEMTANLKATIANITRYTLAPYSLLQIKSTCRSSVVQSVPQGTSNYK
jgi:hypothetical protein